MTKRDYERAAEIAQGCTDTGFHAVRGDVVDAFVRLFADDNPRFDEARFRAACVPGANVKARRRAAKQCYKPAVCGCGPCLQAARQGTTPLDLYTK